MVPSGRSADVVTVSVFGRLLRKDEEGGEVAAAESSRAIAVGDVPGVVGGVEAGVLAGGDVAVPVIDLRWSERDDTVTDECPQPCHSCRDTVERVGCTRAAGVELADVGQRSAASRVAAQLPGGPESVRRGRG